MLSNAIKVIILVLLIALVGWIGLSVYSCYERGQELKQPDLPDMPESGEATHSVYIENSSNLLLTSDYEIHGETTGKRIIILHSFWELSGQKFIFKAGDIVLDEGVFGKITIKRR